MTWTCSKREGGDGKGGRKPSYQPSEQVGLRLCPRDRCPSQGFDYISMSGTRDEPRDAVGADTIQMRRVWAPAGAPPRLHDTEMIGRIRQCRGGVSLGSVRVSVAGGPARPCGGQSLPHALPASLSASFHFCLICTTYLPSCLLTSLPTSLSPFLPVYLPFCLICPSLSPYLPASLPVSLHFCLICTFLLPSHPSYLPFCLPPHLSHFSLSASLSVYLLSSPSLILPPCLVHFSSSCLPPSLPVSLHPVLLMSLSLLICPNLWESC